LTVKRHWIEGGAPVAGIILLALALRAAFLLAVPITPDSDAAWYLLRAQEMAAGMGYQERGHPTAFWPVGYPAVLAGTIWITGSTQLGPLLLNLLAAGMTTALIGMIASSLGALRPAVLAAMLLYAVYPAHIVYSGVLAAETTSTAVLMAGVAVLVAGRARSLAMLAAGLILGLATLMRPQSMLIPLAVISMMWLAMPAFGWRRAVGALILATLGMAMVVAPWTLRNHARLGAPVLVSTNGGIALQAGANDLADGGYFQVEKSPLWRQTGLPFDQRVERQVEMDARLKQMATRWIAEHPWEWAMLGVRKVALLWTKDTDAFWALHASDPDRAALWRAAQAVNQLFYWSILFLSAIGFAPSLIALWRRLPDRSAMPVALAVPILTTALAFVFTGQTRYHYPAMPFLMIGAGLGLVQLIQRSRSRGINSTKLQGRWRLSN
jgi:4-amino-4-deoxy-L-arabinose transferase-like glycosyltransferase